LNLWHKLPLGSEITLARGFDLPSHKRKYGNVPIVSSAGISDYHNLHIVDPPGVVTGRYGTIGELYYIDKPFWPLNTTLYVSDFHGNDPKFIFYFLHLIDFAVFSGKSGVPGINRNDIHSEAIIFPLDIHEQRAIAAVLSDVDELLAAQERLIAKKRDIKQAAMQQLLTGKVRLPGFSGEWEVVAFDQIATIRNFKIVASDVPVGTPCVELDSLTKGTGRLLATTEATGASEKYTFKIGDVLFGRLRAYLRKYWLATFDGICSTEIWPLIPRDQRLCASFLHLIVQTDEFVDAAGVAYGTHMPRSDWSVLKNVEIRLPAPPEQTAIAAVLGDMDAELDALQARLDKTRDLKQAMMQQLLTGKVRLVQSEINHG
jgi:type I restriction enzyme S subunit